MKFSKLLCLLSALLLTAMLLTSCGGALSTVSSVGKYLNEDYDPSADVFSQMQTVTELQGYALIQSNDEFAIFSTVTEQNISYKIFSMRSAKVVATIAENNMVCTFATPKDVPALLVTKTVTSADQTKVETTYHLYDTTGVQVATSKSCDTPPAVFADKVIYNYTAYTVADNGALVDGVKVPEYVRLTSCDQWNDKYYYVLTNSGLIVYSRSFETVCTWNAPSYATNFMVSPMNDGNVLVQYTYLMDGDATKYDYYETNYVGFTEKVDLVSLILSAEDGDVKEVDLDYIVMDLTPNYDLYDGNEENNAYRDDFENIAVIAYIKDKKLDTAASAQDIVLMNNKGKAQKSLKMIDDQGTNLPSKIGDDVYLVQTLYGSALMNGKGKLLESFYNSNVLRPVGDYLVGARTIYNLQMEVVYDLSENDATVTSIMGNTVYVKKNTNTGYEIIAFLDGENKTIYTHTETTKTTLTFLDGEYYEIYDPDTNTYRYYNADGKLLATIDYAPVRLCASDEHGTVLFWNNDGTAASYCVLVI
ncbi:MAG: hypothetical protein IJX94_01820 [Clostridia bacterium]|nr:hypothetical protein [Clostridia bacterium]